MLSLTTDYRTSTGNPEPYLRRIADAGFTHVHWCHQWNTDFLYLPCEIRQIARWLKAYGLQLLDLHGSAGQEKCWFSAIEYQRQAGVELVKNRITMAGRLGSDVVIMHAPRWDPANAENEQRWTQVLRSLDTLEPYARRHGVRIAVENMPDDNFINLHRLFEHYDAGYLGLCYDAGHGNIGQDGLAHLESAKDRLISIHLHDNDGIDDGRGDQHLPPFAGTVDWPRLAKILETSSYSKCVSMEATMCDFGSDDEDAFLHQAYAAGTRIAEMIAQTKELA